MPPVRGPSYFMFISCQTMHVWHLRTVYLYPGWRTHAYGPVLTTLGFSRRYLGGEVKTSEATAISNTYPDGMPLVS